MSKDVLTICSNSKLKNKYSWGVENDGMNNFKDCIIYFKS